MQFEGLHLARTLVLGLPGDRILTETDAPFTRINGRPTVPGDVAGTVAGLSTLRNIDTFAMAETICVNLRALLASAGELQAALAAPGPIW